MKKALVWAAVLFVALASILYILRSQEGFAGPCQYSDAKPNTYIPGCSLGCQTFTNLQDAKTACSAEPTCGGITQRGGQQIYELRSGSTTGPSPSGEISYLCTTPAPTPPPPVPAFTPSLPVAPTSSATTMSGTPDSVPIETSTPSSTSISEPVPVSQAPPTVVLPYNTPPGTYLLRQVT